MRQQFGPAGAWREFSGIRHPPRQYKKCGLHIQNLIIIHSIISILVCIIAVVLGLMNVIYPDLHYKSPVFRQIFRVKNGGRQWCFPALRTNTLLDLPDFLQDYGFYVDRFKYDSFGDHNFDSYGRSVYKATPRNTPNGRPSHPPSNPRPRAGLSNNPKFYRKPMDNRFIPHSRFLHGFCSVESLFPSPLLSLPGRQIRGDSADNPEHQNGPF
ncbi:hypothetical protein L596_013495 [Steinernema carpocapsae]|uniref:Uncharacterized protein n=1 Tax=Steinernema carpocapsae TaxID=34508 RepID=A0A4U5P174_STECR|nr:hypothetical protein L596_013495 [Steinernema carpocapsae]